ncbi:hypothetical protein D3C78_932560 [compost metagenome]
MSENVGSIYYTVEADTSALVNSTAAADQSLDRMQGSMRRADAESQRLSAGLSKLASAIKVVAAAAALREMAAMVQSYQEMEERVRLATSSQEEFQEVQARLLKTANDLSRELGSAGAVHSHHRGLEVTGLRDQHCSGCDGLALALVRNQRHESRSGAKCDRSGFQIHQYWPCRCRPVGVRL